jgi:hypothetical protein
MCAGSRVLTVALVMLLLRTVRQFNESKVTRDMFQLCAAASLQLHAANSEH